MASVPALNTPLTKLLGIKYPVMLAGMARTSGGPLAAAVSNAGGIGTIGGLGYTPTQLQEVRLYPILALVPTANSLTYTAIRSSTNSKQTSTILLYPLASTSPSPK